MKSSTGAGAGNGGGLGGWSRCGLVGEGGWCRLCTAGLLGCTFWGIGTCCVNVLVLHIALPLIHIRTFLSIGIKKILHTIWYLCPCFETPEAMPNQFDKILLLNLSTGQHSWKTHGAGFMKPFDHIFPLLKNKNREPSM